MAKETVKDRCSFCGRSEREVGFPLLTGYTGCICVDCAERLYCGPRDKTESDRICNSASMNCRNRKR